MSILSNSLGDKTPTALSAPTKVYGSETLENGGEWQYPTNSLHRFFKVSGISVGRVPLFALTRDHETRLI